MEKARRNKTIATFAFVLILTMAALMAGIPATLAVNWPTYAYITVEPDPVGVNQQVLITMWLDKCPPTATGPWGDRWKGFKVEVTKPDGTKETKGPFTSDSIGFAWTLYTPTIVGTYYFQFSFPGQTLAGENLAPGQTQGTTFIGDYFEPSTSPKEDLTVQQEAIQPYPSTPLPTDYWTRPIDAQHLDWWSISGNWLASPPVTYNRFAPYTKGPETAHILWAKELTFGGLVGGEYGVTGYYSGNAYEGKWWPPVIIDGILYYNKFPSSMAYDEALRRAIYYMPGVYAVDLRTGEEIWYNPNMRIDFGQVYRFDSGDQHGAMAYLWQLEGVFPFLVYNWTCYDAYTGQWFCNITNVPTGTRVISPKDGTILQYVVPIVPPGAPLSWLALWNSSALWELTGAKELPPWNGTASWMWRPYNKVVDGLKGFSWNVTISPPVVGSINYVLFDKDGNPDRIIGSWMNATGIGYATLPVGNFIVWCLSIKRGEEGKLLWKKEISPPTGAKITMGPQSMEDKVFTVWCAQTLQWWGYSLDNGNLLWGPTDPQTTWDFTFGTGGNIAYGKLFSCGMGGIVYCYDVKTGKLLWTYEAKCPYYFEVKWGGRYLLMIALFADGKIYIYSGEHSPDDPKERGAPLICIDVETGKELWTIPFYMSHWARNPAISDGILVYLNVYDNRIYAFGKGQTATEVSASPKTIAKGDTVLIEGRVTDQSPGAKGTPAIADENMTEWMKYLYMQFPCPMDIHGVDVILQAKSSNGTIINIATVTGDGYGCFAYKWTPPDEDTYTIMAIFTGSKSYWASYAQTGLGVTAAPPPPVEAPAYTGIDLAIIGAIIAVAILVLYTLFTVRKQRK